MTDYRTPQEEAHPGDLAPDPATGCYSVICEVCGRVAAPLTPGDRPTRDYFQARRWLRWIGWSDSGAMGAWCCPYHPGGWRGQYQRRHPGG